MAHAQTSSLHALHNKHHDNASIGLHAINTLHPNPTALLNMIEDIKKQ